VSEQRKTEGSKQETQKKMQIKEETRLREDIVVHAHEVRV